MPRCRQPHTDTFLTCTKHAISFQIVNHGDCQLIEAQETLIYGINNHTAPVWLIVSANLGNSNHIRFSRPSAVLVDPGRIHNFKLRGKLVNSAGTGNNPIAWRREKKFTTNCDFIFLQKLEHNFLILRRERHILELILPAGSPIDSTFYLHLEHYYTE
jgi:hypothetical protein